METLRMMLMIAVIAVSVLGAYASAHMYWIEGKLSSLFSLIFNAVTAILLITK